MDVKGINSQVAYSAPTNSSRNTTIDTIDKKDNKTDQGNVVYSVKDSTVNKSIDDKDTVQDIMNEIEDANKKVFIYDRRFEFSIHEKTNHVMVKVYDTATDEIIREIPPEKMLDLVASLWEISGIIVDEKI